MRLTLALVLVAACSSSNTSTGPGSGSAAAAAPGAFTASGKRPANARHPSPASVIRQVAGARAPAIELPDATGATWSLASELTRTQRVVLVFYRGDW